MTWMWISLAVVIILAIAGSYHRDYDWVDICWIAACVIMEVIIFGGL